MRRHALHFQDLEQEELAARLGMWVFLASEVLLFAGLFTLYIAYRVRAPAAFSLGISHNDKVLGTVNTLVLIGSSFSVVMALRAAEMGRRTLARLLLGLTLALAATFLVVKGIEYGHHFREGIWPGGRGAFFAEHPDPALPTFYSLYFLITGTHALHVIIGMAVLVWVGFAATRRDVPNVLALDLGALYWHLVDVVWIFLWPLFYLTGGHS